MKMRSNLRRWTIRIRNLLHSRPAEEEFSREVNAHLALLEETFREQGMPLEEARQEARRSFGNVERVKDFHRDVRSFPWVEDLIRDLRYAFRTLAANRGFTLATVITLALGIGANVAVFSLVYGVLLRPLPYGNGDRLVVLHQRSVRTNASSIPFSVKEIEDYRENNHTLDEVVEHHSMRFLLFTHDSAERVSTAVVSANFFDALGTQPLYGRTFVPEDDLPESDAVLVLSYPYWQRRFGGDPGVLGQVFEMNDEPHTVIGILPPVPQYPVESDVYMPTSHCPTRSSPEFIADREARMMTAFGVMKPDVRLQEAQTDLSLVAAQMAQAHPDVYPPEAGYSLDLASLTRDLTRRADTTFLLLLSAVGFVLLIACANVANLLLARLLQVQRELSLRMALGASRGRMIRQLVTESTLLSLGGGLLGLAAAPLALQLLIAFAQRFTTRAAEVRLDGPVLLFAFFLSVVTGLLFGLGPAIVLSRNATPRQDSQRATSSRTSRMFRSGLVVVQVAVSLILLTGAGLMIRSFARMQRVELGFRPEQVLTLRLSPDYARYASMEDKQNLRRRVVEAVEELGPVQSIALASSFPFNRDRVALGPMSHDFEIEGERKTRPGINPDVDVVGVTPGYFETMGQAIVQGRSIDKRDDQEHPPVAVINQTMARDWWPNENPIGKHLRSTAMFNRSFEIVGIASDVKEAGLDKPVRDQVYLALPQNDWFGENLVVRARTNPMTLAPGIRSAIRDVDPLIAVDRVETVDVLIDDSAASAQGTAMLLALFAGLAVLISCAGIAAVMALSVRERTGELGIRMALGATRESILSVVTWEGFLLALAGALIGIAGSVAATRLLAGLLYETSPTDAFTFAATTLLFLTVAALACLIPAWKVTRIDPASALRCE